jgi:nucleoside-diphosphate-sugar epimerase
VNEPAKPTIAVTGASGYLGTLVTTAFEAEGWQVTRLTRRPTALDGCAVRYDLNSPMVAEVKEALLSADLLIHAAYDMAATKREDIWRINVDGTRRLLEVARDAQVERVVVISSMSAYEGTTQLYGRAKLAIEAAALEMGACAVRPGLIYGDHAGGMAGVLQRLSRLPVVAVMGSDRGLLTVRDRDLTAVLLALATAKALPPSPVSVAHPTPVRLPQILRAFAAAGGNRCRVVELPWQIVYRGLRLTEAARLPLPFRADSVLGLVHPAPRVVNGEVAAALGIPLEPFSTPGAGSCRR